MSEEDKFFELVEEPGVTVNKGIGDEQPGANPEAATAEAEKIVVTAGGEGNLYKVFDNISATEQVKLALGGNRTARQFVMRKSPPVIKRYLLKNPKISEIEVADIASLHTTNAETLESISKNKEWMKVDAIRLNIRLLPFVKNRDMHRLLKDKCLRSAISAALRRMLDSR
jgi:hypothetical protein